MAKYAAFYSLLYTRYVYKAHDAIHMAFPIGFKRSRFSYIVQMQGGSSDSGLFAVAFATSLCCGFNPAQVQYIFPEPSYAMPTEQVYDNISIMQKTVICNSSHKARNNHNSRGRMVQCGICEIWNHEKCRCPRSKERMER